MTPTLRLHESVEGPVLRAFLACANSRNEGHAWTGRWTQDEAYGRWKFAGGPERPAMLVSAWADNCMVATMSLRPMPAIQNGEALAAGEIGDLFVAPGLRGQGLFRQMADLMALGAKRHGYQFVFCVPNSMGLNSLERSGAFMLAPQAERVLCVLPLIPSAFLPQSLRALGHPLLDPPMRGWLRLRGGAHACDMRQGLPLDLPNVGDPAAVLIGGRDFFLASRAALHPDAGKYQVLQKDGGWTIVKPAEHHGRAFLLVGAIKGPTVQVRKSLLRALISDSLDRKRAAIALWAPRATLWDYATPATPFLPVGRKQVMLLKTDFAAQVISRNMPINVELLDTDKI